MFQNDHGYIIKVASVVIKEEDLISEVVGTTYSWEVGHDHEPPIMVNVPWWGVVENPFTWDIWVEFLCVLDGLVNDDRGHEALPIWPVEYQGRIIETSSLFSLHLPHYFSR